MAPHHGSLSSGADLLLAWVRPAETVVSGGDRAGRPEVQQMLSFTGSGVRVTATSGAVRVRIGPTGKIAIRTWHDEPW